MQYLLVQNVKTTLPESAYALHTCQETASEFGGFGPEVISTGTSVSVSVRVVRAGEAKLFEFLHW